MRLLNVIKTCGGVTNYLWFGLWLFTTCIKQKLLKPNTNCLIASLIVSILTLLFSFSVVSWVDVLKHVAAQYMWH